MPTAYDGSHTGAGTRPAARRAGGGPSLACRRSIPGRALVPRPAASCSDSRLWPSLPGLVATRPGEIHLVGMDHVRGGTESKLPEYSDKARVLVKRSITFIAREPDDEWLPA